MAVDKNINPENFFKRRLLTYSPAVVVLACLLGLGYYVDHINSQSREQDLRISVLNQLNIIRAKLEGNINSDAQLVKGLVAAISTEPKMSTQRFQSLSRPLLQGRTQLRNIAAAPDLIIRYMYPVAGNESAIGLNYRKNPQQYAAVKEAVDAGELVIAGPVNLVQGGQGFIARIPVYLATDSETKGKLWGLISAVIDTDKLYAASGLEQNQKLKVALRGKDAKGEEGKVFFGMEEVFSSDPVLVDVNLPYGSWQMAALPEGGWAVASANSQILRLTLILAGLIILIPLIILGRYLEKHRENETLLRGLFELSPLGIALNDYATGDFIIINDALIAPTGYTQNEFMNLSYWDLTPQEYEEQEKLQLQMMEQSNRYGPYEKEYIRKDGSRYPVLLRGIVVFDTSGKKLIWSIIEDISERKHNEKMKNEFISTVSHELRTPLTSILGSIGLVAGGALGELPEKITNTLKIAINNTERLTSLINDLLEIDKLNAGKLTFDMQKVELISQIETSIINNQSYAEKYKVQLTFLTDVDKVIVKSDPQRLQQVLANLISNAVKFSPENNTVDIQLKVIADKARVEVSDHGAGIPKEFYQHIFTKFAQADSSDTRKRGGTGLGLSISREIIEQMNGNIGFESIEGQGAMFYFEIPVSDK